MIIERERIVERPIYIEKIVEKQVPVYIKVPVYIDRVVEKIVGRREDRPPPMRVGRASQPKVIRCGDSVGRRENWLLPMHAARASPPEVIACGDSKAKVVANEKEEVQDANVAPSIAQGLGDWLTGAVEATVLRPALDEVDPPLTYAAGEGVRPLTNWKSGGGVGDIGARPSGAWRSSGGRATRPESGGGVGDIGAWPSGAWKFSGEHAAACHENIADGQLAEGRASDFTRSGMGALGDIGAWPSGAFKTHNSAYAKVSAAGDIGAWPSAAFRSGYSAHSNGPSAGDFPYHDPLGEPAFVPKVT